jgi:hypothetical protein
MTRLSSCYFCGATLDASLEEYPIVPSSLQPAEGERQTVVLCQSCHHKLDRVLDTVVDAFGDPATTTATGTVDESDGGSDDPSAAASGGLLEGPEPIDVAPPGDDDTPAPDHADGGGDTSPRAETSSDPLSEETASGETEGEQDRNETADDGTEQSQDDVSGPGSAGGTGSVTKREYNKVIRLLQNREFPVDRREFIAVASNAYQLSEADCERILDVAVDQGALDEDDGELVRTDD